MPCLTILAKKKYNTSTIEVVCMCIHLSRLCHDGKFDCVLKNSFIFFVGSSWVGGGWYFMVLCTIKKTNADGK